MDISRWTCVSTLTTPCDNGFDVAVCPVLNLLVTSNLALNTVSVFNVCDGGSRLAFAHTLGGPESPQPMRFEFVDSGNCYSGYMAFSGTMLLVTDAGHDAVHVVDINARAHIGYVGGAGAVPGPRGVATRNSLAAISCWKNYSSGEHTVRLYECYGTEWVCLRTMGGGFVDPGRADGQLNQPYGLRVTGDASGVAVADAVNSRVSLFAVGDGSFIKQVATGLGMLFNIEECEGGWLAACPSSHSVVFMRGDGVTRTTLGNRGTGEGEFNYPTAAVLAPGLGLVVRDYGNDGGRIQVFVSPDMVAMSKMSSTRVAWMCAVYNARPRLEEHPLWKML